MFMSQGDYQIKTVTSGHQQITNLKSIKIELVCNSHEFLKYKQFYIPEDIFTLLNISKFTLHASFTRVFVQDLIVDVLLLTSRSRATECNFQVSVVRNKLKVDGQMDVWSQSLDSDISFILLKPFSIQEINRELTPSTTQRFFREY